MYPPEIYFLQNLKSTKIDETSYTSNMSNLWVKEKESIDFGFKKCDHGRKMKQAGAELGRALNLNLMQHR